MSESGIKFRPVMGTEEFIKNTVQSNGYMYVATDTGNMYLDVKNRRISIGGAGGTGGGSSSFVWANGTDQTIVKATDDDADTTYIIDSSAIEDGILPKENHLILNSDGRFFRVLSVDLDEGKIIANLIAVSGSGGGSGGGGGSTIERDVDISWDAKTISTGTTYIYGQPYEAVFTPTTTAVGDTQCTVTFNILDRQHNTQSSVVKTGRSGVKMRFDTSILPESNNITLQIIVTSDNSQYNNGLGYQRNITGLKCMAMSLEKDSSVNFIPMIMPTAVSRNSQLRYIPHADGSLIVTQHVYVDEIEISSLKKTLNESDFDSSVNVAVPEQSHGVHDITIKLSANVNGTDLYTDAISYQAAWAESNNENPIIWVGKYDDTVINYEPSYIEFMVYDPVAASTSTDANVTLYKENVEIGQMQVVFSNTGFTTWDISTIYEVGENNYSIVCRSAKVNISNTVTTVGSRDLDLVDKDSLMINYSTAGRSNNEVISQRGILRDQKSKVLASLTGFNWKNNGWSRDAVSANGIDNGSYLTIANDAKVEIPFEPITLNAGVDYTIEMRYRVRNVQKYSTLVKTYAKYFINTGTAETPVKSSTSYTMAQINKMSEEQGREISLYYDEYGSPVMDQNVQQDYEKEEGVICKWMTDDYGLAIGTQEAYFASPRGVTSVRYKEDEVINITVVISSTDNLCYIYLNGILSGADSLPPSDSTGQFGINSNFVINSNYCDVDLYRFRVYQEGLTMPQVIHNYLSDIHSITLYDQNQLTVSNSGVNATKLSYEKLVEYNKNHPEALTMPYATIKIISDNKKGNWKELLPYYKGNKCTCEVVFTNPSLDKALEDGLIDEWYYYTHCPSYRAVGVEINVQGTSSQGYPRRNFKTKFKKAAPDEKHPDYGWFYTKGSLAGKRVDKAWKVMQTKGVSTPVEKTVSKKFHMDNEDIGTNKFTWKIDYMESSGTYNTGYANLMGNSQHRLYTQHPLAFYNISSVDSTNMRTSVYGFPVLTFHEYADSTQNPSASGSYEYIGRYNMNLDKGSNEYYGFEVEKEQPFIDLEWDEMGERNVQDATGNDMYDGDGNIITEEYVKQHHSHPWISQIAECWELSDNQGKWCSWKFPNAAARAAGFRTLQSGYDDRYEMMLHFEYRYSPYADQLDAIGADGGYDGSAEERAKFADEIGTTHLQMSEYAYDKYKNLEKLFIWLDSTDQETATNNDLETPLSIQTPKAYSGIGEVSEAHIDYGVATEYDSSQTYYLKSGNNYTETTDFAVDEEGYITGFKEGVTYYIKKILYYNTTFTKDSAGYRLEKFRQEFDQHLNKEYCLVYFVMTELLLCYDSRGKNMMMASFGPMKTGGEYIWFPIFYDIDTQLGLNNSGAYLWDYDADVTKDGLFSTPTSVLWVNLLGAFEEEIKGKYRALRGLDDKTNVVGSLTYENIAGAYICDPDVFDSYAMKGIRPTIAIGLDEYYKYFATTTSSGVGYFNTDGDLIKEDSPTYAYACQGDKILTTELLLRNRLNYIDSWWMGGDYDIKKVKGGQLQLRVSGNRATLTSDNYLQTVPEGLEGTYQQGNYPVPYYDARPGYKLKPFLKQYISYFTDEVPGEPKQYTGGEGEEDGIWTNIPESTIAAYTSTPETPNEQLNYIPGLDYLSSLGDLSTSYVSEFILRRGKRLLDLILGSDAPGYKNEMIKKNTIFTLSMSAGDQENKPLMKKMVFTGLTSLDKTIDVSGSAKLQEFRALNTNIPNLYLAEGAPLHTLHLPSTIQGLNLIENNYLTKILTAKPNVWEASSADEYKGLYIEGLTDATQKGTGHKMSTLIVDAGSLGYEAYKLLDKFVLVKTIALNDTNPNAGDKVRIGMLNQEWTPYVQVENGELYNPDETYYLLNDHNMFDKWTFKASDWNRLLLNGSLYTIDAVKDAQKNTITDLSLLNKFLTAYDAAVAAGTSSKWGMKDATSLPSVPTITGNIFVNNVNGEAIKETDLTSIYKVRWPNLNITAANIQTSNLSKYVRIYDNGKVETITIERTDGVKPLMPTGQAPSQADYDFLGWSTQNPNEVDNPVLVLSYNLNTLSYTKTAAWEDLVFDENDVITFYAIFTPHVYQMTFKYEDESVIEVVGTAFGSPINLPSTVPHMSEKEHIPEDGTLPTLKYSFIGYNYTKDASSVLDMSKVSANRDTTFYAIFEEVSVHSQPIAKEYLNIIGPGSVQVDDNGNTITGYTIGLKNVYSYNGILTLPTVIDGVPVIAIADGSYEDIPAPNGFSNDNQHKNNISHIFWDTETAPCQLKRIGQSAFFGSTIEYIELPNDLYYIASMAFSGAYTTVYSDLSAVSIQESAFNSNHGKAKVVVIPGKTTYIGSVAFCYMDHLEEIIIGGPGDPSQLKNIPSNEQIFICENLKRVTIYTDDVNNSLWSSPAFTDWSGIVNPPQVSIINA